MRGNENVEVAKQPETKITSVSENRQGRPLIRNAGDLSVGQQLKDLEELGQERQVVSENGITVLLELRQHLRRDTTRGRASQALVHEGQNLMDDAQADE
jgi:hypothetical protein